MVHRCTGTMCLCVMLERDSDALSGFCVILWWFLYPPKIYESPTQSSSPSEYLQVTVCWWHKCMQATRGSCRQLKKKKKKTEYGIHVVVLACFGAWGVQYKVGKKKALTKSSYFILVVQMGCLTYAQCSHACDVQCGPKGGISWNVFLFFLAFPKTHSLIMCIPCFELWRSSNV